MQKLGNEKFEMPLLQVGSSDIIVKSNKLTIVLCSYTLQVPALPDGGRALHLGGGLSLGAGRVCDGHCGERDGGGTEPGWVGYTVYWISANCLVSGLS